MLRSSRPIEPKLLALALCAVAFVASRSAVPVGAQAAGQVPDFERTAMLEVGPESRRGIDELAPDVTPHWYGRYRLADATIDIRYVDAPLERPSAWAPAACPERPLRTSGGLAYYESEAGWSLLVEIVSGDLPPDVTVCVFVDRFIARHLLFERLEGVRLEGVRRPGRAPVFPAVITL
ncbi:MAG: hypothetical protein ACOC7V_11245 [Spirochaetota bacterium]